MDFDVQVSRVVLRINESLPQRILYDGHMAVPQRVQGRHFDHVVTRRSHLRRKEGGRREEGGKKEGRRREEGGKKEERAYTSGLVYASKVLFHVHHTHHTSIHPIHHTSAY